MPVTVVVGDDNEDTRLIVRALLRPVSDVMTFVGDAANGGKGSHSCDESAPTW